MALLNAVRLRSAKTDTARVAELGGHGPRERARLLGTDLVRKVVVAGPTHTRNKLGLEHCTYVLCDFSGEKVPLGGGHTDSCNGYPGSARCCVHFDPQQQQQLFEEWGLLGPDLCHDCGILCEFLKVRRILSKHDYQFLRKSVIVFGDFLDTHLRPEKRKNLEVDIIYELTAKVATCMTCCSLIFC